MQELTYIDLQTVSGGDVDWGAVGIGIAIAATPVGWIGAAGATLFAFGGDFSIGVGIQDSIGRWHTM